MPITATIMRRAIRRIGLAGILATCTCAAVPGVQAATASVSDSDVVSVTSTGGPSISCVDHSNGIVGSCSFEITSSSCVPGLPLESICSVQATLNAFGRDTAYLSYTQQQVASGNSSLFAYAGGVSGTASSTNYRATVAGHIVGLNCGVASCGGGWTMTLALVST